MLRWIPIAAIVLVSCGPSAESSVPANDITRALEAYAPGIQLGALARGAGSGRYHFVVEPYVGYRDSAYQSPTGFGDLTLLVDESLADERQVPRDHARIRSVFLVTRELSAARRAESDLQIRLGAAKDICHSTPDGLVRLLFWDAGGPGVLLASTAQRAAMYFGVTAPDPQQLKRVPCRELPV